MTATKTYYDDEGRVCTRCGEFKPWTEFGNKKSGFRGKNGRCYECLNELSREEQEWRRYQQPQRTLKKTGMWLVYYDPTRTYEGHFSKEEFDATMKEYGWSESPIIWHNTEENKSYITQGTKLKRIKNPAHWKTKIRQALTYNKPPVGLRRAYR